MKIIELRAENFKRLSAVHITPEGALVQITGKNGAGKSSCLDAIAAALGGKDAAPSRPIRAGADRAQVVLDLGDIKVTRKWTADDRSTLVVESADGLRHPSPQAVLDKLVGRLSFDPLGFSRMDAKQQASTLRQLVGLDLSKLNLEHDRIFAQRTEVGRAGKALDGQLAGLPDVAGDTPDAEVSVVDLAQRQEAALAELTELAKAQRVYERARGDETTAQGRVNDAYAAAAAAEQALKKARDRLEQEQASMKQRQEVTALHKAELDAVDARAIETRLAEVKKQIAEADQVNQRVRAKKARAAKLVEQQAKRDEWAKLTQQLKEIEQQKAAALGEAKFPVPGLSLDGDMVTFNGLPLEQASSAEQLRVGLAMGAALNPKLRVVLVRDGSLLDAEGLRLVAEWAEREQMQVIMERVADGTTCGVVIEDGQVAGAPPVQTSAAEEQPTVLS